MRAGFDGETALVAAVAIAGGFVGTVMARALALRVGFVNAPNPLVHQHKQPIAYLGGVGLALGILSGIGALGMLGENFPWTTMLPASLCLALGVADDRWVLKPATKFGPQAGIAALAVATGIRGDLTGIATLDAAVSWFWLVTLINAFNLTDVCDGLLASLSVVMFSALAIQGAGGGDLALVTAGACLGFLALNRPPATIFLGDAGSHLLGFLAGAFTLAAASGHAAGPLRAVGAQALVVGVPLFELAFLTAVRVHKGLAWWKGSPDHFSLRLQAAGLSRAQTDLVACCFAGAWGGCGLALLVLETPWALVLAAGVLLSAAGAAAYLLRHEVKPASP